jgi:hypothetical protein
MLAGLLVLGGSVETATATLMADSAPGAPQISSAEAAAPLSNADAALEALAARAKDGKLYRDERIQAI